ncbi:hypothetical protein [Ruficoccus sp. ZRK36]|uniref:hypothetical protein n=1 Tax=Ruficoccus sp. ZRK36 TaxID=2866311 RepID=UPI001C734B22|nr:hypothetical protein [Ruficoccus sp. ZRK36]QYY37313.1 hypothetical protein K0V07_07460 [Ruficoccus sp. ZRK36]
MNKHVHLTILAASLVFGLHPGLHAREETGDILASLVESVDTKLTNLEASMREQESTQTAVKGELEALRETWTDTDDERERIAIKSEIVKGLSELNTNDRLLIAQSMDTLLSVDEDLQRLQEVFRDGVMGPAKMNRQRGQIRQVLLGVGPLLGMLGESLDSPQAKAQAATTEQTLVLLYQQLEATSSVDAGGMLNQINATTEALEEVAAQLAIVQGLLEMERYQLEVASQVSITELLFARLGQVRFGDRDLVNVPKAFQDGVASRNANFSDVLNSSSLTNPSSTQSAGDKTILRNIRNGNVPQ